MKGPHRSRPISDILDEVKKLRDEHPLSEINLIGQDAAAYGFDLEKRFLLADLVPGLAKLVPDTWIRILYAHPAHVTPELIQAVKAHPNVCRYLDLPIEHSHPRILEAMNRGCARETMDRVIDAVRQVPGMALRTAVIVGFPGETEAEYQDLLNYLEDVRFERLGAFTYSQEEGTRAYSLGGQIPEEVKKERYDRLMELQREITSDWNRERVGKTIKVLIEEETEKGAFAGRSEADAPEVDGQVFVHAEKTALEPGQFVKVTVTDALDHDVVGELTEEVRHQVPGGQVHEPVPPVPGA